MFRWVAAGAIAVLCFVSPAAAAEPFDDFVNLCVNNDGRREVVIAKAEERGWFRLPAEALPDDGEFRDTVAFLSADPEDHPNGMPADLRMIMVGRGDSEKLLGVTSLEMEACAVVLLSETSDSASWAGRLDRLLGFGAKSSGADPLWVFSRAGSGFRSESDLMDLPDDQLSAAAKQRDLYIAGLLGEDFSGLLFAAIRPVD